MTVRRSMKISITESLKPTQAQTWVSPNRTNGIADILQIFPACISPLELPYTVWWVWARAVSDCIHATPRSHTLQDNTAGRCCSSDTRWDVTSSHNAFSMCLGHGVTVSPGHPWLQRGRGHFCWHEKNPLERIENVIVSESQWSR